MNNFCQSTVRQVFDGTVPMIAIALVSIATALEEQNALNRGPAMPGPLKKPLTKQELLDCEKAGGYIEAVIEVGTGNLIIENIVDLNYTASKLITGSEVVLTDISYETVGFMARSSADGGAVKGSVLLKVNGVVDKKAYADIFG